MDDRLHDRNHSSRYIAATCFLFVVIEGLLGLIWQMS